MDIGRNAPVMTRVEILIKAPLSTDWNLFININAWPDWNKGCASER
jgi:hypothetical protein